MNFILKIILVSIIALVACQTSNEDQPVDHPAAQLTKIDSISGLVIDENFELVRGQCTTCHSAKLITQNSASREGWEQMIRWMQRDQGLWDLGATEPLILDYLSEHYGIKQQGRRVPLTNIEWYSLTEQP